MEHLTSEFVDKEVEVEIEIENDTPQKNKIVDTITVPAAKSYLACIELEYKYLSDKIMMQMSKEDKTRFRSVTHSYSNDDMKVLEVLIPTLLNKDNTSTLSDSDDFNVYIYRILHELSKVFVAQKSDQLDDEQVKLLLKYSDLYTSIENVKDLTRLSQEDKNILYELNHIISKVGVLKSLDAKMRTVYSAAQDFKDIFKISDKGLSRAERELEPELGSMREKIRQLKQALSDNTLTIYREIHVPVYENNKRGYKYVCGQCGNIHFNEGSVVLFNHLSKDSIKNLNLNAISIHTPDWNVAHCATFSQDLCPDCGYTNLFTVDVLRNLRVTALHNIAQGRYQNYGNTTFSEVNLNYAIIKKGISQSLTQIVEVEEQQTSTKYDFDIDLDSSISSFISLAESQDKILDLTDNMYLRNLVYLKYLFSSTMSYEYSVDSLKYVLTLLENLGYSLEDILLLCSLDVAYRRKEFLRETSENVLSAVGEQIYKDICVYEYSYKSSDKLYKSSVEEYNRILNNSNNLFKGKLKDASELSTTLLTQINEMYSSKEHCATPIKSYSGEVLHEYILTSPLLYEIFNQTQHIYLDYVKATVLKTIRDIPIFMRGKVLDALSRTTNSCEMHLKKLCRDCGISTKNAVDIMESSDSLNLALTLFLDAILNTQTIYDFEKASKCPLKVLSLSLSKLKENSFSGIEDKFATMILMSCLNVFSETFQLYHVLERKDIESVVSYVASLDGKDGSMDEARENVYTQAYLFGKCMPSLGKDMEAVQKTHLTRITEISGDDIEALKNLGL